MFVVFDLDGTLADLTHRLHFIKRSRSERDWDSFYAMVGTDVLIEPVAEVYSALIAQGHRVEIWSGRSDRTREDTELWFRSRRIPTPHRLIMRSEGDFTPDEQLKKSWLRPGNIPDMVFDDRQRVVDMWRAQGILCAQVAEWKE